jgi:RNA polymerase sigma factor (TIGR02999 family)
MSMPSETGTEPVTSGRMRAAAPGDTSQADALFGVLYGELHRLSRRELARHGFGVSLGVTTLLHEAYIQMAARSGPSFPDRAHFMAYASRVMRGLVIDHVRNRGAHKRGGQFDITSLDPEADANINEERALTEISDALDSLAKTEPSLSEVVDLKFFCGFSFAEIASMRSVSERTVQRMWDKARIYLHRSIHSHQSSSA